MHEPSEGQVAGRKFCFMRGGKYILYICILKTENTLGQLILGHSLLGLPALQFRSLSLAAVILSFCFYFPSLFFWQLLWVPVRLSTCKRKAGAAQRDEWRVPRKEGTGHAISKFIA